MKSFTFSSVPAQQEFEVSNHLFLRENFMATGAQSDGAKLWEIIRKASSDKDLKARLLKDSASVFKENSIAIPKGMSFKVLEDTNAVYNFIIPPEPEGKAASVEKGAASKGPEQLLTRAWSDKAFKKVLLADTMKVLKENGIGAPEGLTIKAFEDTDKVKHLVIPLAQTGELSDSDLDRVAGGKKGHCSNDAYTKNVAEPTGSAIGSAMRSMGLCNNYWKEG